MIPASQSMAKASGGEGTLIAGVPEYYLIPISLGAVFCGAITYIGNGPNFMVKSVAEADGVPMPSFGRYIGYAFTLLVPVLADHALPGVPIHVVYSSRKLVTAALAAFLDFVGRLDLA